MTRMTREFSLVLLGAGALTGGYFLWPEQDFQKRTEEQARRRIGATAHVHGLLWLHAASATAPGGQPAAVAGVSRGGFGTIGTRLSGGRFAGVRAVGRIGG
jgi:hypothetical protein